MFLLALYHYKEGIQKISFTRFLQEEKNISLSKAKNALDKFLEGIPLVFFFSSRIELQKFRQQAESLGAVCKIIDSSLYIDTAQFRKQRISKRQPAKRSSNSTRVKPEYSKVLMLN